MHIRYADKIQPGFNIGLLKVEARCRRDRLRRKIQSAGVHHHCSFVEQHAFQATLRVKAEQDVFLRHQVDEVLEFVRDTEIP
ncbi:hypothetical protein D3C84_518860 [compost metagenome]